MKEDQPLLIAAAVVALSLAWPLLQWIRKYLETKHPFPGIEVPLAGDNHFLFGHLAMMLQPDPRKTMEWAKSFTNDHGQVALWAFRRPNLYVSDWRDARTILNKEHHRHRPPLVNHHVSRVNGERGLLALNGKDWRYHRLAVTRTFNPDFLSGARKDIKDVCETMVEAIKNKITSTKENSMEMDVEPLMKNITLDIFGKTALTVDLKSCSNDLIPSPMAAAFEYLLGNLMVRMRNPLKPQHLFYWLPTEMNRRQEKERHLLRSFLADLINEKRKERESGKTTGKDLLSHLLQAHSDVKAMDIATEKTVTDENLTDIVMSLFVAGFDTTSITLACSLFMLAQNPNIQDMCVKEIQSSEEGLMNPDKLVYCNAVLLETLRMYPPAVVTLRTLTKPLAISGGLVVPIGTDVTIPIFAIHHDETIFPRPNEFRPDRWVSQDAKGGWMERTPDDEADSSIAAGNRHAMFAFSGGGRNCVGMKFASLEAVLALANLLNGLQFEAVPGFELKTSTKNLLHKPDGGVLLKVRIRN